MVLTPTPIAVTMPPVVIVAVDSLSDVQSARDVTSCELLSENVPVAVNCCVAD